MYLYSEISEMVVSSDENSHSSAILYKFGGLCGIFTEITENDILIITIRRFWIKFHEIFLIYLNIFTFCV